MLDTLYFISFVSRNIWCTNGTPGSLIFTFNLSVIFFQCLQSLVSDLLDGVKEFKTWSSGVFKKIFLLKQMYGIGVIVFAFWLRFKTITAVDFKVNLIKLAMYPFLASQSCDTANHIQYDMPHCHTFVSYFWGFQMSTISRVFGLQLWNLAALLILTCSFSWLVHFFGWWNSIYANWQPPYLHKVYSINYNYYCIVNIIIIVWYCIDNYCLLPLLVKASCQWWDRDWLTPCPYGAH